MIPTENFLFWTAPQPPELSDVTPPRQPPPAPIPVRIVDRQPTGKPTTPSELQTDLGSYWDPPSASRRHEEANMIVDSVYFVKDIPQHYHQLKNWPDTALRDRFYEAIKRENDSLKELNTYEVVRLTDVPPGTKLVPVWYVFNSNPAKTPTEKARLCVRGDWD